MGRANPLNIKNFDETVDGAMMNQKKWSWGHGSQNGDYFSSTRVKHVVGLREIAFIEHGKPRAPRGGARGSLC